MPDAPDLPENLKEVNSERHLTTLASITITPASVEKARKSLKGLEEMKLWMEKMMTDLGQQFPKLQALPYETEVLFAKFADRADALPRNEDYELIEKARKFSTLLVAASKKGHFDYTETVASSNNFLTGIYRIAGIQETECKEMAKQDLNSILPLADRLLSREASSQITGFSANNGSILTHAGQEFLNQREQKSLLKILTQVKKLAAAALFLGRGGTNSN